MEQNQNVRERIGVFSDFFKEAGLNEQSFMVPETGTWAQKAAAQLTRLKVAELVLNRDKTANKADTGQWKYTPYFRIIKDERALAGFRLSCFGYDYDRDVTVLGARPELLTSSDAIYLGREHLAECELLMQYQAMADAELMEKLRQKL